MRGFKQIGSTARALIAVFLLSYSFSISLASSKDYALAHCKAISKGETLPLNSDAQSPVEVKEEEVGDEFQYFFSLTCVPSEILSIISAQDLFYPLYRNSSSHFTRKHVPIYLAKHSLII